MSKEKPIIQGFVPEAGFVTYSGEILAEGFGRCSAVMIPASASFHFQRALSRLGL
jgi:hypothetical protein